MSYFRESRSGMKSLVRSWMGIVLILAVAITVSASWVIATAIPVLKAHTTALIMGGTLHPLSGPKDEPDFVTGYLDNAVTAHLNPAFGRPVTNAVAVFTPEEFFPLGRLTLDRSVAEGRANLHRCIAAGDNCVFNDDAAVVPGVGPSVAPQIGDAVLAFGYSQSSVIASLAKQDLIRGYEAGDPAVSFMLVANPMRPNGGVLMRGKGFPTIPILGISFAGASPTDSAIQPDGSYAYPTVDIVRQYDGLGGDFPVRPLNLIALVNSLLGYHLLHGETVDVPFDQAHYQGHEGDTNYYLVATDIVPILQPLALFIPEPILQAVDAPLRVIIEDAYDRGIGPGVPTPFRWSPVNDLSRLVGNLIESLPVAADNLFEGFGFPRLLGTEKPGAFGVGGPKLPDEPGAAPAAAPPSQREALTADSVSAENVVPDADPATEPADAVQGSTETLRAMDDSRAMDEEPTPTASVIESGFVSDDLDIEESSAPASAEPDPELDLRQDDPSGADGSDGEVSADSTSDTGASDSPSDSASGSADGDGGADVSAAA